MAKKTGISFEQIEQGCVRCNLNIGHWGGTARTNWSDLGLVGAKFDKAYTAGSKKLLPDRYSKEIQQLEDLARDMLRQLSYPVSVTKRDVMYLMPKVNFSKFNAAIFDEPLIKVWREWRTGGEARECWAGETWESRWLKIASEIAQQRDLIVTEIRDLFAVPLAESWRVESRIADNEIDPPRKWIENKLDLIVAKIPNAECIRQSFYVAVGADYVISPEQVIATIKENEFDQRESDIRRKEIELQTIDVYERREIAAANIAKEREVLERERQITAAITRSRKAEAEAAIKAATTEINLYLRDVLAGVLLSGLNAIKNAPESITKNGKTYNRNKVVNGKWVSAAKETLRQIEGLNFTDNSEIKSLSQALSDLVNSQPGRDENAIRTETGLRELGKQVIAQVEALAIDTDSSRNFSSLENAIERESATSVERPTLAVVNIVDRDDDNTSRQF